MTPPVEPPVPLPARVRGDRPRVRRAPRRSHHRRRRRRSPSRSARDACAPASTSPSPTATDGGAPYAVVGERRGGRRRARRDHARGARAAARAAASPSRVRSTKGQKPELAVQKLTELGVDRIMLVEAARSVVHWDDAKVASGRSPASSGWRGRRRCSRAAPASRWSTARSRRRSWRGFAGLVVAAARRRPRRRAPRPARRRVGRGRGARGRVRRGRARGASAQPRGWPWDRSSCARRPRRSRRPPRWRARRGI